MKRYALPHRPLAAVLLALVALSFLAIACGSDGPSRVEGLPRVEGLARVTIGDLAINAEVPEGEDFYRGLAGRGFLPDDLGMLFVFSDPRPVTIWMKGMLIPIDIIWISAEGRVVHIETAQPEPGVSDDQLKRYVPEVEAQYVLEVRAGLAAEKGVEVGDEVLIELP